MSEPLRVILVTEGPTDRIVLDALLPAITGREFVLSAVYPDEHSLAFGGDARGFGWRGVLRWCEELRGPTGIGIEDALRQNDLLVIHLDGDVARALGCELPCPPAEGRAEFLRAQVADKLGLQVLPTAVVVAIPMDALEGWLLRILRDAPNEECSPDPARLFQGGRPKLVEQSGKKPGSRYKAVAPQVAAHWARARDQGQFERFVQDLDAAVAGQERR